MTIYNKIKELCESDLAMLLCDLVSESSGCEECPVNGWCENGRNGFHTWLNKEYED